MNNSQLEDLLNNGNFSTQQLTEIKLGIENGLTSEQIMMYAKEEYSPQKMSQIRIGLNMGLSLNQIMPKNHSNFDWKQRKQIKEQIDIQMKKEQSAIEFNDDISLYQYNQKNADIVNTITAFIDKSLEKNLPWEMIKEIITETFPINNLSEENVLTKI